MNVVHFSRIYICFFPTEWTSSISSWIIYFSRICPFFTRWEVFSLTSAISFRVNSYQFFLSDKFVLFYLFASFLPGFLLKALMSQTKDFCGHFKVLWDNHPSCAYCFHCSRQNTWEICCSWPLSTWLKFEQRRSYKPGWKEEICICWDVRGRWPFWSWRINNCSPYEQSWGISSSDDIVSLNTDQPDRPRAKRRGSQCGTPPSGSGFSHWKVRSHSSPDRFTGQRSLGESTSQVYRS